jgi:hypothetical protein
MADDEEALIGKLKKRNEKILDAAEQGGIVTKVRNLGSLTKIPLKQYSPAYPTEDTTKETEIRPNWIKK